MLSWSTAGSGGAALSAERTFGMRASSDPWGHWRFAGHAGHGAQALECRSEGALSCGRRVQALSDALPETLRGRRGRLSVRGVYSSSNWASSSLFHICPPSP
eukprot:1477063-Pyramimonas_sp.AAC.1